jgi:hypothetical protein
MERTGNEGRVPYNNYEETDVLVDLLNKGVLMGKSAVNQVKEFDEKYRVTASAAEAAASIDQKLGITDKWNAGTVAVNQGLKNVDEKYQISVKAKSALAVAEDRVNVASSAITKNVLTGTSWVTGALSKALKAADEAVKKAKDRHLGQNVAQEEIDEPLQEQVQEQEEVTPPKAASTTSSTVHEPAPPRLYVYNPHGVLLRVEGSRV